MMIRPLIPSQTALVLGGGGAKGAYEIGAIAALEDLGVRALSVYGTSVGALNAAMYAQGNLEAAAELWSSIRLSDVISEESLALADDAENAFDHPEKLLEFVTRYAQRKGVDVTPLVRVIARYVDEDAVRRSGVRLGLVTTRFPSMNIDLTLEGLNTLSEDSLDVAKGIDPNVPENYFPNDDPAQKPLNTWRSVGQLLYTNWLNYYVYQTTPFDINEIGRA